MKYDSVMNYSKINLNIEVEITYSKYYTLKWSFKFRKKKKIVR